MCIVAVNFMNIGTEKVPKRIWTFWIILMLYINSIGSLSLGGPKMSGNFVRERQRIVYIYIREI